VIMGSPKKMSTLSKYSLNFLVSIVAPEMRSFNSGWMHAMSLDRVLVGRWVGEKRKGISKGTICRNEK